MASLPARQQSQHRRSSPEPQSQPQAPSSPSLARSAISEDSQTLFLNTPEQTQDQHPSDPKPTPRFDPDLDPDIKKCWICFSDATEDTPETSPWRDPCPCALVAHEECLLDWIADTESPSNLRRALDGSLSGPKIECPQCKHEIKLARPRDYIVEAVRGLERLAARAITPGALAVLSATVWNASTAWGVHSIYAVFGPEDGSMILRSMILNVVRPVSGSPLQDAFHRLLNHLTHWRLYVGLPLITPALILSRTKYADSVLPVLPILFFATQTHARTDGGLDLTHWPPSASLSFAVLPYIRSAYNLYYERVWAEKERRWMKVIQPRTTQAQDDDDDNDGEGGNAEGNLRRDARDVEDDNVFEVRIDGGIWDEWGGEGEEEDPGQPQPDAQRNRAEPQLRDQPPLPDGLPNDNEAAAPAPDVADNRQVGVEEPHLPQPAQQQPQPQQQQNGIGNERRLAFSTTALASTVLGALAFPTIASISGELLKLALPRSWTTSTSSIFSYPISDGKILSVRTPAKGLLQEKWGRSLVGGCAFVVLKDFVGLYVRWKMAEMHRRRRVVDYERKGRGRGRGRA